MTSATASEVGPMPILALEDETPDLPCPGRSGRIEKVLLGEPLPQRVPSAVRPGEAVQEDHRVAPTRFPSSRTTGSASHRST